FIWIITPNGLQRYDGSRFLNFPDMISGRDEAFIAGAKLYADQKSNRLWILKPNKIEKLELLTRNLSTIRFTELLHHPSIQFDQYTDENNRRWLISDRAAFIIDSAGNKLPALDFTIQPLTLHKSNPFIRDAET